MSTDSAPPIPQPAAALCARHADASGPASFAGRPDIIGTPFAYTREEEIYGEGEEAEFVYKVLAGAVRTHRILNDGRRQITGFRLPGDLFGFGEGETHRHTAEALSATKVLIFNRRRIERAAAGSAAVACHLWTMATNDLRHAQELAVLLGRRTAQERIAAFLIEVDGRLGGTGLLTLPMTRRDIADYLGLTVETVSRTLSQLEEDGVLLRHGGRHIRLRAGLRRMAGD